MARINPIDPGMAEGKAKTLLDGVQKRFGVIPNMKRTMDQSPAVLDAYLGFGKALGAGTLDAPLREQIALTVAGANSCDYCAAAHTAIGSILGLDGSELSANLNSFSSDPKIEAALIFARRIVDERGWVSDEDMQRVRDAGYTDGEIVEIIAVVALNTFSNYFNHIAQSEIDFPPVRVGESAGQQSI